MKIRVTGDGKTIFIPIPNALIFNRLTAYAASRAARKHLEEAGVDFPPDAMERLFAALKAARKQRGEWQLVEVQSADGEYVQILL